MRRWASRIGGGLFTLAVLNFASFFVLCLAWGGDAINGKVQDGRYYLGRKGRHTEVSEGRWRASRAHAISVFVTHSLGLFVGGPLLIYADRAGRRRRRRAEPDAAPDRSAGESMPTRRFALRSERFVEGLSWQPPAVALALLLAGGVATLLGAQAILDWCFTGAVAVVTLFFALIGVRLWVDGWSLFGELRGQGRVGRGLAGLGICLLMGTPFVWVAVAGAVAFVTQYWGPRVG